MGRFQFLHVASLEARITNTAVLIVRSGERRCALPASHIIEVFRPLPTEPLGEMPDFVLGLAVIRGAPTPVVDLNRLLGDKDRETRIARYVTLRAGSRRVALAVEEVLELREPADLSLEELPPLLRDATGAVEAMGALDSQLLLILSASRLVPGEVLEKWHGEG